jgi:hypothetical protein
MKSNILFITALLTGLTFIGCQKNSEDEFNDANGTVPEKLIKKINIINKNDPSYNYTYTVNYDAGNQVSSYTDGESSSFLNFDQNGNLNSITNAYETLNMSELYQAPYDAFESGDVIGYDNNGNPSLIEVWKDGFGSELLNGEIIYDPNPNPYFYTLKAAGIIEVLDQVDLNFGYNVPSIVKARKLLFFNNPRAIIFKNMGGITENETQITYEYDADGYPIKAEIIAISLDETSNYDVYYTYK